MTHGLRHAKYSSKTIRAGRVVKNRQEHKSFTIKMVKYQKKSLKDKLVDIFIICCMIPDTLDSYGQEKVGVFSKLSQQPL